MKLSALLFLLCVPLAHAGDPPPDPVSAGKISASSWSRVQSGEISDLLVQFQDPAIDAEVQADLHKRRLKVEDGTTLNLRAQRYAQLKTRASAALASGETQVRKEYSHLPMRFMHFNSPAALQKLLASPRVVAAFEDSKLHSNLAVSLPLIGQPTVAQTMGHTGSGTTVVVLDTGVNYTRSEFGSCTAPGVPAGCKVSVAFDEAPNDNTLDDATSHGTRVSDVVAATAPGAKLIVLDVYNGAYAYSTDVIAGINWAIANKSTYNIVSINMSMGDDSSNSGTCNTAVIGVDPVTGANIVTSTPYVTPIALALNAGILTVISSGNDGYSNGVSAPACTSNAVVVGATYDANVGNLTFPVVGGTCTDATTAADRVACFSNSSSQLTLLAPGAAITVPSATSPVYGTSYAAPFVSAAVAVLKSAFPSDSPAQTLARMTSTGTLVTDTRTGRVTPRLNLLAAQGAPANDAFVAAASLSGSQVSGWNYNASKESGEPIHAGNSGGKSVWWNWTAPASGSLSLNTHGSSFDTLLAVYTGNAVNALTQVAANDDDGTTGGSSSLSVAVVAGTTYHIAVDGKSGASGSVTLNESLYLPQNILFNPLPSLPVNSSVSLVASATSGLPVVFSSATPSVCTLSGNVVNLLAPGTCTIVATQPGQTPYLPAASVTQAIVVVLNTQSISFAAIANQTLGAAPFTVTASADSGLPVTLSSLTGTVCTLSGGKVSLLTTGTCSLQATQAGNGSYQAAVPQTQSFSVQAVVLNNADVPLPPWALLLLAGGLVRAMLVRR